MKRKQKQTGIPPRDLVDFDERTKQQALMREGRVECPQCHRWVKPTTGRPPEFTHYMGMGEWACDYAAMGIEPYKSLVEKEQ